MLEKIHTSIRDVCDALGFLLWGVEYPRGKNGVLRVYIETMNDEVAINVDDCAAVSERLSVLLDGAQELDFAYTLEVSSPGLVRTLFEHYQYERYIGGELKVKLKSRIGDSSLIQGKLLQVLPSSIRLEVNKSEVEVPFDNIKKSTIDLL